MCRFSCHFLPCYFNSSCQLKRLRLANCEGVSDGGLSGVAAKLPLLEELSISYCPLSKEALEAVGRCCPLLKSLQFNNYFRGSKKCHEEALAIAENMSKLRCLNLVGTFRLTNDSLQAILDGCPHLESLDLRRCRDLTLEGNLGRRCAEQIKDLRLPHDSIDDYEFKKYFFEHLAGIGRFKDIDHLRRQLLRSIRLLLQLQLRRLLRQRLL
ncbi:putative F-box/LRR-repeat protein 23 [Corylus avellana]|uniref:putative F-box/LRR-repeat protein 23 n=1 Tax=Corylus avellana TaxID=13451 RepID=UPI00286CDEB5|nr:putative F-box/LRR-repeat protein 23 [Corylus avellana]